MSNYVYIYFFLLATLFFLTNGFRITSKIKISLANLYLLFFFSYTLLPIISCYFNNEDIYYANKLLVKSIIILLTLNVFTIFYKKLPKKTLIKQVKVESFENTSFWAYFWGTLNILFLYCYIYFLRGGIKNFLSMSYRESYVSSNTIISSLLFGIMPYALIFLDKKININKKSYICAHIFVFLHIFVFILGGQRNFAMMIVITIIWIKYKNKNFNIFLGSILLILTIIFLGLIAVFREYNIVNVLQGEAKLNWNLVWKYVFSIAHGELGTTLKFEKYCENTVANFSFPFKYGYSYTILTILNIIPRFIFKNKPLAYSDYFSRFAFGEFNGIGYGFSPIYEAELNFGNFWYVIFGILWIFIYRRSISENDTIKSQTNGLIACLGLNFFRIDFAVVFKFFLMIYFFKILYLKCLKTKLNFKNKLFKLY